MPRKAVIICALAAVLAAAGCATTRKDSGAPAAHGSSREPTAPVAAPAPTRQTTESPSAKHAPAQPPRPKTPPASTAHANPHATLPALIEAQTAWVDYGRSLVVTRGNASSLPPVPIFRQAIVLASVRAAVAGSPAGPKAEFHRGLITLTFMRGTSQEIAAAVNRAIAVPEVLRLGVYLAGG